MGYQILNRTQLAQINVANANLDGTGSITALFTAAGPFGSNITSIRIQTLTNVTVGMIRFFLKPSGSVTFNLVKEVPIPEVVVNDPPYPAFATSLDVNLMLAPGDIIGVSTQNNELFTVAAFGFDITGFI